jgi:recombination protein RecT
MELLARRYGINCPENITVELIYSTDKFSIVKKDLSHPSEGYVLEVTNAFDRGEIIGGVSLSEYANPIYNKVRILSMKEIEKRVKTNSPFWTNWRAEMCEKTVGKNAWSKVVLNTTELAEYYATKPNEVDFEPENTEELPFDPNAEL